MYVYTYTFHFVVLSTQAMLGTLLDISSHETTANAKNSAAATINWILKDGLGQAGGIALVSLLGSRLDCQARSLRFYSTVLFVVGSFLEFSIPLVANQFVTSGTTFLVMASSANVLKNVSWMLVSATRAHFMKNFALKGNLGDLTGKAASQMTCASLIGTGLGLLVLKCFPAAVTGSFFVSALVGLFSTFKSCKVGLSRQLTANRVFKLIETLSNNYSKEDENKNNISRYIWTPEIIAERENFLWETTNKPKIVFNAALNTDYPNMEWIASFEELETKRFTIAKSTRNNQIIYYVWFLESAGSADHLNSIVSIALNHYKLPSESVEIVVEAIKKQGWDTEHFNCKIGGDDGALKVITNKEE